METIVAWAFAALLSWQPPGRSPYSRVVTPECGTDRFHNPCARQPVCSSPGTLCDPPRWSPEYAAYTRQENADEGRTRYEGIARDAFAVVYDPATPALFAGPTGRGQGLIVLLSTLRAESGLRKDVDEGRDGSGRGDKGASWCLGQIQVGSGLTVPEGWSGRDLAADHAKCFSATLRYIRASLYECRKLDRLDRLSQYITGQCIEGHYWSHRRVRTARDWLAAHPTPVPDANVLASRVSRDG